MDPETAKALITAVQSVALVALGALVSWFVAKAAEERKARREDALAEKKENRAHLQERLALQKAALTDYQRTLAKWAKDSPSFERTSIVGTLERARIEEIESHADTATITLQISNAFGSPVFGEQAGMTILLQIQGRKSPTIALTNHLMIGECIHQMQRCIDAHSDELGLPKPKTLPEPFFPADEFIRQKKRFVLKSEGLRGGIEPKRIVQELEKAGLGEAPPSAASKIKPKRESVETETPASVEPIADVSGTQEAEDELRGVEEAAEAERQAAESVKTRSE